MQMGILHFFESNHYNPILPFYLDPWQEANIIHKHIKSKIMYLHKFYGFKEKKKKKKRKNTWVALDLQMNSSSVWMHPEPITQKLVNDILSYEKKGHKHRFLHCGHVL